MRQFVAIQGASALLVALFLGVIVASSPSSGLVQAGEGKLFRVARKPTDIFRERTLDVKSPSLVSCSDDGMCLLAAWIVSGKPTVTHSADGGATWTQPISILNKTLTTEISSLRLFAHAGHKHGVLLYVAYLSTDVFVFQLLKSPTTKEDLDSWVELGSTVTGLKKGPVKFSGAVFDTSRMSGTKLTSAVVVLGSDDGSEMAIVMAELQTGKTPKEQPVTVSTRFGIPINWQVASCSITNATHNGLQDALAVSCATRENGQVIVTEWVDGVIGWTQFHHIIPGQITPLNNVTFPSFYKYASFFPIAKVEVDDQAFDMDESSTVVDESRRTVGVAVALPDNKIATDLEVGSLEQVTHDAGADGEAPLVVEWSAPLTDMTAAPFATAKAAANEETLTLAVIHMSCISVPKKDKKDAIDECIIEYTIVSDAAAGGSGGAAPKKKPSPKVAIAVTFGIIGAVVAILLLVFVRGHLQHKQDGATQDTRHLL